MGQVLAELGGVDPGGAARSSELTVADAPFGHPVQRPQVERQPGDGRLGYAAFARLGTTAHHVPELQGTGGRGPGAT